MSDKKTPTARREEEVRVSASHLINQGVDDKEDWGSMPNPKNKPTNTRVKDEDEELESELNEEEEDEDEDEEDDEDEKTPQETSKSAIDPMAALAQLEQLQGNMPALIEALKKQKDEIAARREELNRKLDEEEAAVKKRLNFALVLTGQPAVEENQTPQEPVPGRRRRGRRRRTEIANSENAPATPTENVPHHGRTGKRFHNDMTLKEAIVKAMFTLPNYTGSVNEIANKVITIYKTTSSKPTNTVRIQMYRLQDEDHDVCQNENGTYSLTKKAIQAMQANK